MKYTAINSQSGSIGAEILRTNLMYKLHAASKKKGVLPINVIDVEINQRNLSPRAAGKYQEYRENIMNMDFAGAIKYTANFCKKGFATYVPAGTFKPF